MIKYPAQIDNNTSLPVAVDNSTPIEASLVNKLREAIVSIESELGTKPSAMSGTVKARLDSIENSINTINTNISNINPPPPFPASNQWDINVSNPTLNQVNATSANGQSLNIHAQNATTVGGILKLAVGTGAVPNGNRIIELNEGFSSAIRIQVNPSASTVIAFQPAVTNAAIQHNLTAIANGSNFAITAQSTTGSNFNGGNLNLKSGSASGSGATGNGGDLSIVAGNTNATSGIGGDIVLQVGTGATSSGEIKLANVKTSTTAPVAGGGAALPATPAGYVTIYINGSLRKLAYY